MHAAILCVSSTHKHVPIVTSYFTYKYKLKDKIIENSKTEQQNIKPISASSENGAL